MAEALDGVWRPETAGARLERLTDGLLDAVARADSIAAVDPTTLIFLLRRYAATDRDDLRDMLGAALALALDALPARRPATHPGTTSDAARWLTLLIEASAVSDDARLLTAASGLDQEVRGSWPAEGVAAAAGGIEACLAAAGVAGSRERLQSAVDELERLVSASYRPGGGVGIGGLEDQVAAASALLTAFALTGRLPYSMLAEELMQCVRRTSWDARHGGLVDGGVKPFAGNCEAARVCCRLESLRRDEAYRQAAVVAGVATYVEDAELMLASQTLEVGRRGQQAAVYGIALADWLHLSGNLK